MLVNTSWLLEYLEPKCSEADLLKAIVGIGLEVEAYHPLAQELESIIVGFIREKTPLEGADGMFICRAEIQDEKSLQVVCASEHPIEIGWGVPIARGGTRLPTGIQIKNERFHGVFSEGMICLDSELGMLARGTGLQVFHDEPAAIGKRLVDLIEIPDSILDLKVTANRPDCLGLIGIAREVAAALDLSLKLPPSATAESPDAAAADFIKVKIDEPELCRRYMCRVIKGVSIAKSPAWLSSRLKSTGSNPINNVVDITNFVMREWGQPLHAFDLDTLKGAEIIVRKMQPSENLELLDGTTISGEKTPLVIADAERPVALAGIMGGRETQINHETVDVLLEAANFDPIQIKKSLKELGLDSTDAAYRFERGMDPNETVERALDRAAALIAEVAGGTIIGAPVDAYPKKVEPKKFQLSAERVNSYLGTNLTDAVIKDSLEKLGMKCSDDLLVEVPTRRVEANNQVVLIEDVARLTGYDQIPMLQPKGNLTSGKRNALDSFRQKITLFLADNGFLETRNIALESPQSVAQFSLEVEDAVKLVNSKEEMSVLRKSLLPGLLETVSRNARREAENFRYFELDRTFRRDDGETIEKWVVTAVAGGLIYDIDWSANKTKIDFYHVKGVIEVLLESLGITNAEFHPATHPGFTPGQTAEIKLGEETLGVIGTLAKELLTSRKIKESVYGFELNLEKMLEASAGIQAFKEIPRMPAVVRDIAMVFDNSVSYSEIEKRIRGAAGDILEEARCIDIYEGKHIERNRRSVSVRLRFRAAQRTLSTEEVSVIVERIIDILEREYRAKLRE
jgi:phenylalanyl-tRNA synthetase beta chain